VGFLVAWAVVFGLCIWLRMERNEVVSNLTATTERVAVRVDSEQLGQLRLRCATQMIRGQKEGVKIDDATLRIPRGGRWTAVTPNREEIFIRVVSPNGSKEDAYLEWIDSEGPQARSVSLPAVFTIAVNAKGCPKRSSRLAIHGMVELGEELKASRPHVDRVLSNGPYLLLEGEVAMHMLITTSFAQSFVEFARVPLQPGARFIGGAPAAEDGSSHGVTWSGFVEPGENGAMDVRASSSGQEFRVLSESVGGIDGASINIDLVTLVLKDPLLILLAGLFGAFEVLFIAIEGSLARGKERELEDAREKAKADRETREQDERKLREARRRRDDDDDDDDDDEGDDD